MFFNRNKKPKLGQQRFQHRHFTQKLNEARNYKRNARAIPEHPVELFLMRIGLGSRWAQVLAGAIVLGILYLIYIPNFLTVQQVKVQGLSDSNTIIAEGAAKQSLSDAFFLNPQHNLVFLSQERVKQAVAKVPSVYQVTAVKKDFKTKSLLITVSPKYERFLVSDGERVYDVYNDGVFKGQAGISKDGFPTTINPNMLKVVLPKPINPQEHEQFFTADAVKDLETIANGMKDVPNSPLSEFFAGTISSQEVLNDDGSTSTVQGDLELPISSGEIKAVLEKNNNPQQTFVVMFDGQSDLNDAIARLKLLLSQTTPDRYKNLFYIDMRLSERAYICLVNTSCAK